MGDQVFMRISPWERVLIFRKKGKLSPLYMGLYEIMKIIGEVASWYLYASKVYDRFFTCVKRSTG